MKFSAMSSPASSSSAGRNADLPAGGTDCDKLSYLAIEIAQFMKNARRMFADLRNRTHRLIMAMHDRWGSERLNAPTRSLNRPPSISLDEIWVRDHSGDVIYSSICDSCSIEPTCDLAYR